MKRWPRIFRRPLFLAVFVLTLFYLTFMKHEYDFESITDKDRVGAVRIIRRPLAKEAHDGNQGKCTLEFHALSFDQTTWRQFNRTPIFIRDGRDVRQWDQCQVGCRYAPSRTDSEPPFDTSMGGNDVLLSMESAVYYPSIALEAARQAGVRVVMTTNLKSDVPVGYFSWAEYAMLDPPRIPTNQRINKAVVMTSNCNANSFRMAAVDALMNAGVPMDRFGVCYGQRSSEDKVSLISRYKFYLAFENSIEPDYVTEKFFQPLAVGTVPISIGAPNIGDFAPSNKSYIHIARLEDASTVAERIKRLLADQSAYDEMLEWKQRPDDQFLALVDMAVVHSACRLCLHLASEVRLKEIQGQASDRLCQCSADLAVHRLLVRERGRVEFESIAFNVNTGTLSDLQQIIKRHFESLNNGQFRPIWSGHRRDVLGTEKDLRLFRIYAVGLSQREALFTSFISTTSQLKELIRQRPCPRIEVIFI